jgi:hypothetical protein
MTTFATMAELRTARNQKLKETDVLLVSDLPMTGEDKTAVMTYRQALRDLPSNFTEETVSEAVLPPALTAETITKFLV